MKRFLRRTIFCLVPAALAAVVLGVPTATPKLGLQNVNLSCNDGTNLALALDAAAVTQLSDAVSAINLYPAGDPALACSLTTSLTSPFRTFSASNGPKDFAVGGGQFFNPYVDGGCEEGFAISAHVPADTPVTPGTPQPEAGGTANLSFKGNPPCTANGELVSKVDCVSVSGNDGKFTSTVTKSTGFFSTFAGLMVGNEVSWDVKDLSPLFPDEIFATTLATPCQLTANATPTLFSIDRGNISVHDN